MRRHRVKPTDIKDFDIRNLSQIAETAEGSSKVMAVLLAIVASISLLVGGIGIMNILLVSVTERTREIGLRMAVGAQRMHVLMQFLAEAVLISVSGGLAGIVAGVLSLKSSQCFQHGLRLFRLGQSPSALLSPLRWAYFSVIIQRGKRRGSIRYRR